MYRSEIYAVLRAASQVRQQAMQPGKARSSCRLPAHLFVLLLELVIVLLGSLGLGCMPLADGPQRHLLIILHKCHTHVTH